MSAVERLHAKARYWQGQIAGIVALSERLGKETPPLDHLYQQLERLYEDEFPLAKTIDASDLLAHFLGPAVESDTPAASVVTYALGVLRDQIIGVSRSLSLLGETEGDLPEALEPQLSGLAKGSLFVGIRIPTAADSHAKGQIEIAEALYPLSEQLRGAVRGLAVVSKHISDDEIDEGLRADIPDPGLRDALVVAASRIAPTGRKGISSVGLSSKETEGMAPLTPRSRTVLRQAIAKPKNQGYKKGEFAGAIRKIDLDARRFEIRNVAGIGRLRCAYLQDLSRNVSAALGHYVRVKGSYETADSGMPRMLYVDEITLLERPQEQRSLI